MKNNEKQYFLVIGARIEKLNFASIAGHKRVVTIISSKGVLVTAANQEDFIKLTEDIQEAGFVTKEDNQIIDNFYQVNYQVKISPNTEIKDQWRMPSDQKKVSI